MMFLYCYFILNQIKKHGLFRHCDLFFKAPLLPARPRWVRTVLLVGTMVLESLTKHHYLLRVQLLDAKAVPVWSADRNFCTLTRLQSVSAKVFFLPPTRHSHSFPCGLCREFITHLGRIQNWDESTIIRKQTSFLSPKDLLQNQALEDGLVLCQVEYQIKYKHFIGHIYTKIYLLSIFVAIQI